ncbi:uncharacterized protein BCR38DRAFT_490987 [Pseudomassariella vexata]|uniref:Uncharacterized protein n=1 Tax=Pseudomassariella vexata TaxID=1141098 RepID=A0A1Y2D8V2_9PEZI|nr:uncharacterized protein BCR38DRAFT_490987 [Pseudomassariella vexata]ORY55647.1 hypothetical protein BCR38DRAFT_490987 [Pseudomassariella vexata]
MGFLSPLLPPMAPTTDSDWDTKVIMHNEVWKTVETKRLNSGDVFRKSFVSKEALTKLHLAWSLPLPILDLDFRMAVTSNPNVATVAIGPGFKKWTTFTEGAWSGVLGSGSVVTCSPRLPQSLPVVAYIRCSRAAGKILQMLR